MSGPFRRALIVACASLLASAASVRASGQDGAPATQHMAVAANPLASEAGLRILRAGGGAVDAAIAVQLVLSLVEPQSSGIGGGAFLMLYDWRQGSAPEIALYEGRETAPAAAGPDLFLDETGKPKTFFAAALGGLPVGVPGVMRMLEMAHRDHGRLPWADLFAPAIELAEAGFEISPRLHFLLDRFKGFARGPVFRATYYDAAGDALPVGHKLKSPAYGATLRLLASEGAEAMYSGKLASDIVAASTDPAFAPGRMTLADLKGYRARKSEPLCAPYRAWEVCGPKLPSSGGVTVLEILGLIEPADLSGMKAEDLAAVHRIAEAMRLAYADRERYLADDDFVNAPVSGLLSKSYLTARAKLIQDGRALESVEAGAPPLATTWNYGTGPRQEGVSTSHFSIADRWGDVVAMTSSVQGPFGSQVMVGGFILNNQLTDFSFMPEIGGRPIANRAEGGKRPLSSMSPTLVMDKDKRIRLAIGSPGGTKIIAYVATALIHYLDWNRSIQEAVAAPHFVAEENTIEIEAGTGLGALAGPLAAMGHSVAERELNSGLHAIAIDYSGDRRVLHGGVDPRREGVALGE